MGTTPLGFSLLRELKHVQALNRIAWSPDGSLLAAPSSGQAIYLWDTQTWQRSCRLIGHTGIVYTVAWSPDGNVVASGSSDATVRLWNKKSAQCFKILKGHTRAVYSVAWSPNGTTLASCSSDGIIYLWNIQTGEQRQLTFSESPEPVYTVSWSPNEMVLASSSSDQVILWDVDQGKPLRILRPSSMLPSAARQIYSVAWSSDGSFLASGSADCTIRLWDSSSGREIRILESHTGVLTSLSFSMDNRLLASKSRDKTVRIWRTDTWREVTALAESIGFNTRHAGLAFHPSDPLLATLGEQDNVVRIWALDIKKVLDSTPDTTSIYYTNAKIALVGDSGVGKSALGLALTGKPFTPTESTHGRKVLPFSKQEVELSDGRKEIHEALVWDLAGQPGYRLIHQLHLSEISIALIVFDSRNETDPFAGIHHWVNALRVAQRVQGASAPKIKKFLIAARMDRSGTSVSDARLQNLMRDLNIDKCFAISAKEHLGIEQLKEEIEQAIQWSRLPKVTSTDLFQRIKDFLLAEKNTGRLLSTVDDLYRAFLKFDGVLGETEDLQAQFVTCIRLLEAKGLIRHFNFGNLVLLQPEWLDTYASALVDAARDEPDGLGSIREEKALAGDFPVPQDERITDEQQEKLLLIALVKDLLHYEIALREQGNDEPYLVFLFQSTRENLDLLGLHEREKAVIFYFKGPVLNIYATLAVRLSHSDMFIKKDLWRNAITYTTRLGGTYGLFLNNTGQGSAELILFFDEQAREETCFYFEEFVKAHLQRRALSETIQRRRIFVCPECKTPVTDLQASRRRSRGYDSLKCNVCDDVEISLLDWEAQLSITSHSIVSKMNEAANQQRDHETAQSVLQGKIATNDYDVFLCHNAKDKPEVRKIGEQLKEHGILPWLDEWELRPGLPWQRVLEQQIECIKTAAVFIGKDGIGPWQHQELDTFLREFVRRGCPVIPVLLSSAPQEPTLPLFLKAMTWVNFREPDPLQRLIWGIKG